MYSYEIDSTMKQFNYTLPSYLYLQITDTSPQISSIKYSPYDGMYELCTDDGGHWIFSVYYAKKNKQKLSREKGANI